MRSCQGRPSRLFERLGSGYAASMQQFDSVTSLCSWGPGESLLVVNLEMQATSSLGLAS